MSRGDLYIRNVPAMIISIFDIPAFFISLTSVIGEPSSKWHVYLAKEEISFLDFVFKTAFLYGNILIYDLLIDTEKR